MGISLHNAAWPGLVGKEPGTDQSPFSLSQMLEFTTKAEANGKSFDGIDLFLLEPHVNPLSSKDDILKLADEIAQTGLKIGSIVAPVWPGTVGGCAFGAEDDRKAFVKAVELTSQFCQVLDEHGVRESGVIRIDSAGGPEDWAADALGNTKKIAETFRESGKIAEQYGQRLAAEGEICWGGMHSWKHMLDTLEETGLPETVGFQADLAHTYLYLLGVNAPDDALLSEGYGEEEFWAAYAKMTDALRPWTFDYHVAQNDGSVHGTGSHDKTGRHCTADDPNGKLDIARCSTYWLKDYAARGIKHICWDGCMFDNALLEKQETWNTILEAMVSVQESV